MKIHEVEALAGITKKNIRFYEEQGLLSPRRNAENGYREYGEAEVRTLLQIKLLRKLGLPIEEIRRMLTGSLTVGDGMRRHLIDLEREQRDLRKSAELCMELQDLSCFADQLDAAVLLQRMEEMERSGTTFRNRQTQDVRRHYVAPVVVAAVMVSLLLGLGMLLLWAYRVSPEEAPPVWFLVFVFLVLAAVGTGTVLALTQRIREIGKGEIEDAKRY